MKEKAPSRVLFLCVIINKIKNHDKICVPAQKKESGELSILLQLGLPTQLVSYMEICAYHLAHPDLSQWKMALLFNTSKRKIWNAYHLLYEYI